MRIEDCDHIIGSIDGFEEEPCHFVYESDVKRLNPDWRGPKIFKFDFCPICGKKLAKGENY